MIERDPDQRNGVPGYTAYILRTQREVFSEGLLVHLLGIRLNTIYIASHDANSSSRSEYYGQPSRIFVKDGAPIDPAVFDLFLPPESPQPEIEKSRSNRKGEWLTEQMPPWDWVRDQVLPRVLDPREIALYQHLAGALNEQNAALLRQQIAVSQIVYETHRETRFVVNADVPRFLKPPPVMMCGSYDDEDGTPIEITLNIAVPKGVLVSADRRRSDGKEFRYTIPEPQNVRLAAHQKPPKHPWGAPNSIYHFKIGRTESKVRLGPDGRPVPGSMIQRVPGILGFGHHPNDDI